MTHMSLYQNTCGHRYEFIPYIYNFGDNAGIDIMKAVTSCRVTRGNPKTESLILGLGSTLHHLKSGIVWGTGAMEQTSEIFHIKGKFDVRALRGKLTERLLNQSQHVRIPNQHKQIAYGDPGLLIPCLLPYLYRMCVPKHKVCLVPHNNDRLYFAKYAHRKINTQVIHTNLNYKQSLRRMMNCNLVLSSSLHGIVFAEAFGIAARWLSNTQMPSFKTEHRFKYCDYYSGSRNSIVIGDECMNKKGKYNNAETIEEGLLMGGVPPLNRFSPQKLIDAFPFEKIEQCEQNHNCDKLLDGSQEVGKSRNCSNL